MVTIVSIFVDKHKEKTLIVFPSIPIDVTMVRTISILFSLMHLLHSDPHPSNFPNQPILTQILMFLFFDCFFDDAHLLC